MGILVSSIVVLGAIGLVIGLLLGFFNKKFAVEVDERVEAIRDVLPGNNCGACGYPGCDGLAEAISAGEAPVNGCPVGGPSCAAAIGEIMGTEVGSTDRMVAFVKCAGDRDRTRRDYEYTGIEDCKMMPFVPNGGPKMCNYGCLGYGSCVRACPFDAIHVIDGVAVVDKEACRACKACVNACPKHIIEMVPYDRKTVHVACSNQAKGREVMDACDVGCISCKKCEKECPFEAIHVDTGVAHIDYEKCKSCGKCVPVCPRGTIQNWRKPKAKAAEDNQEQQATA